MFIRRKVNKSGTISVHVVDKSRAPRRNMRRASWNTRPVSTSERILKAAKSTLTLDRVREVTKTMYRLNYFSPRTNTPESVLLQMDEEQKMAYDLIHPASELG